MMVEIYNIIHGWLDRYLLLPLVVQAELGLAAALLTGHGHVDTRRLVHSVLLTLLCIVFRILLALAIIGCTFLREDWWRTAVL